MKVISENNDQKLLVSTLTADFFLFYRYAPVHHHHTITKQAPLDRCESMPTVLCSKAITHLLEISTR
jgi:hypothetical protein